MSVVATEIVRDEVVGASRHVVYRCQDSEGMWHRWGPLFVPIGESFDAEAYRTTVASAMAEHLARVEAEQVIDNG